MTPCGAKTRSGTECQRPAGWGTPHQTGRCKLHGGRTPSGQKAAQRQEAVLAVATYGLAREIDPHAALLEELHRTAGAVAWLQQQVATLELDDVTHLIVTNRGGEDAGGKLEVIDERVNVWVDLYQAERTHFVRIAKTCVDVGIDERRIRLAEQQGEMLAQVIRGVLTDLGVANHPEAPAVVRRHLTLAAGQAA